MRTIDTTPTTAKATARPITAAPADNELQLMGLVDHVNPLAQVHASLEAVPTVLENEPQSILH